MNENDIDVLYGLDSRRSPSSPLAVYEPWSWRTILGRLKVWVRSW